MKSRSLAPLIQTPEEETLAMVPQQHQQNKKCGNSSKTKPTTKKDDKNQDKSKKAPPFANLEGKLGDTKQWNDKTYFHCPANHKYSHWYTHKVEDCHMYKKEIKEKDKKESPNKSNQVTVNLDELKKGMAALFPSGDFNTDDLAEALSAVSTEICPMHDNEQFKAPCFSSGCTKAQNNNQTYNCC